MARRAHLGEGDRLRNERLRDLHRHGATAGDGVARRHGASVEARHESGTSGEHHVADGLVVDSAHTGRPARSERRERAFALSDGPRQTRQAQQEGRWADKRLTRVLRCTNELCSRRKMEMFCFLKGGYLGDNFYFYLSRTLALFLGLGVL